MPDLTAEFRRSVVEKESQLLLSSTSPSPNSSRKKPKRIDILPPPSFNNKTGNIKDVFLREAYLIAAHIQSLKRYLITTRRAYLNIPPPFTPSSSSSSFSSARLNVDAPLTISPLDPNALAIAKSRATLSEKEKNERDLQAKVIITRCMEQIAGLEEAEKALQERRRTKQSSVTARLFGTDSVQDAHESMLSEHKSAITWLLNQRLMEVSNIQATQQSARIARAVDREENSMSTTYTLRYTSSPTTPLSKQPTTPVSVSSPLYPKSPHSADDDAEDESGWNDDGGIDLTGSMSTQERLLLEAENEKMYKELETNLDQVRQTEQSLLEISTLQSTLSRHLAIQASETERLHQEAMASTERVVQGNDYLVQARRRNADARKWVLFFLIMASGVLLFLDWYD